MDFCPAFWDWIVDQNGQGLAYSIDKVGDELLASKDDLATWREAQGSKLFLPADEALLGALPKVADWVQRQSTVQQQSVPASKMQTTIWWRTRSPTITRLPPMRWRVMASRP
jgi:hypothetical protein